MTDTDPANLETGFDSVLGFTLPDRNSRGRVVRLGPVLDRILGAHNYPPAIKHCLAEALALTALMGSLLKDEGDQLTIQAQSKSGLIRLLVCDYRDGELRGYAEADTAQETAELANATKLLANSGVCSEGAEAGPGFSETDGLLRRR